jgi:hypothetical protein
MGPLKRSTQRQIIHTLAQTPMERVWDFRVVFIVPDTHIAKKLLPADTDTYVREITTGGYTIEYESYVVGSASFNAPKAKTAGTTNLVVRDNMAGDIGRFLHALSFSVINKDGTVNLPAQYTFTIAFYQPSPTGDGDTLRKQWLVSAETVESVTYNTSETTELAAWNVGFKKYSTLK